MGTFFFTNGEEENQSVIPSNKIITACLDEKKIYGLEQMDAAF